MRARWQALGDGRYHRWSLALEEVLFAKGTQAENQEQEVKRGAYGLIQGLRQADRKWGKDYTDAVLHELLKALFQNTKDVQDLLAQVSAHKPYHGEEYAVQKRIGRDVGERGSRQARGPPALQRFEQPT